MGVAFPINFKLYYIKLELFFVDITAHKSYWECR